MNLTHLSPKQLDRLAHNAQAELDRRRQRRSKAEVVRLLRAGAADAGYSLAAVFPELMAPPKNNRKQTNAKKMRAGHAPVATAAVHSKSLPQAPFDGAQRLVRCLGAAGSRAVGLSQSIEAIRSMMNLGHDWPAFHAALELAARRNWIHFRGNDQCVLTLEGFEEATR